MGEWPRGEETLYNAKVWVGVIRNKESVEMPEVVL